MYKEIFLYPAIFAYFLLIIHSIIFRGGKKTLTFFGTAFIFGLIREILYSNFVKRYVFTELTNLRVFDVPIAAIMGWTFTFYIGLFFAQKLLNFNTNLDKISKDQADSTYEEKVLPVLLIASVFATTVSLAIETCAINMGWWDLLIISDAYLAPAFLFFGWFGACFFFLNIYLVVQYKALRQKKLLLLILNLLMLNIFFESENLIFAIIFFIPFLFYYKDLLKMEIFIISYMVFTNIVLYAYNTGVIDQTIMHLFNIPLFFTGTFFFCLYFIEKYRKRKSMKNIHPIS